MLGSSMVAVDAHASTPLVRLQRFSPTRPVYAKLEHLLLTGGAFDRVASSRVEKTRAELEAKGTAVIAGSGSVCLAFAAALARVKTKLIAVCPKSMLPEHRLLLALHPLELVLSDAEQGLDGAHARAKQEVERSGGALLYSPLEETGIAELFETTIGRDLAAQLAGQKEVVLVAPLGSRALLSGVARALSQSGIRARTVATVATIAAKATSPSRQDDLFTADAAPDLPDTPRVIVDDRTALAARSEAARTEGLLVGLSSAGALAVARDQSGGGATVAIIVDAGDRYFSVDREAAARGVAP